MTEREKLDLFIKSVLAEASTDSQKATEQFDNAVNRTTKQAEESIAAEIQKYETAKKAEITARERRRVRSEINDRRHKLLEFREERAKETYQRVIEHLEEFTRSDKYPDYLAGLLADAVKRLPENTRAEIYLRADDMFLSGRLKDIFPGPDVSFGEGNFSLGGLLLSAPQLKLRIDMSFDSAMSDIIGHFSELSGMKPV